MSILKEVEMLMRRVYGDGGVAVNKATKRNSEKKKCKSCVRFWDCHFKRCINPWSVACKRYEKKK